ncbi:hypothetical protein [Streptomyces apricus]|uniref:Uncharacterized protein n=1 Tax=Streptomyces apricus TaxID=1828112 RepID=A0A5B0AK83_9ACTN|nr:hypothetical protein [Streptomyces apricus]KAA0929119.1 hypothetical protein FGF04_31040 [Streptomyces apricus]
MLDLTLRLLARVLHVCTPRPRGRHRLGALPPLRFVPLPPPRSADDRLRRGGRRATRIHGGVQVASR